MLDIQCPTCGARFQVPDSLKDGVVNCRECRELIPVPGTDAWDKLFHAGVALVAFIVLGIGIALIANGAVEIGVGVIVAGTLIGGLVYLAF